MSEKLMVEKRDSLLDELLKMHDRIASRAYEVFCGQGNTGSDMENWLEAERELVWKPPLNLEESETQFSLTMEMPGIAARDLKIECTPEQLLVHAETQTELKKEQATVHVSEIRTGSLFRCVVFPKPVDPQGVKAELKNGVLSITAPIAEKKALMKVEVHAA